MRRLRAELDDPAADDCGRCSVCTGVAVHGAPDEASVRAALAHLRGQTVTLEPRKMWPTGAPRRGRIAPAARAEPGRALALAEDPAWLAALGPVLAGDEPVPAEVFDGLVRILSGWGWPAGRPSWVSWVPSRTHPVLLGDLATRLAGLGRMSVATPLAAEGPGFQREAATGVESARTALSRLRVAGTVPDGPVLLLDDLCRSGYTLTVAAALLREAGAGPVYPLVLHKLY